MRHSAGTPVTEEPVGLTRQDGKRPDGLTLIPWQRGKPLTWDVTVVSTLAASYFSSSARSAGAAADLAASQSLRGEIYEPHQLVYFSANRSGIPRFVQCQFSALPHHFGQTPDGHLWRLARDVISIPKTLVIVQRFDSVLIHESFVSQIHFHID